VKLISDVKIKYSIYLLSCHEQAIANRKLEFDKNIM